MFHNGHGESGRSHTCSVVSRRSASTKEIRRAPPEASCPAVENVIRAGAGMTARMGRVALTTRRFEIKLDGIVTEDPIGCT